MEPAVKRRITELQKTLHRKPQPTFSNMGMASRRLFVWALIGANRTGKSSTLVQMVKWWRRYNPGKKLIAYDPQGVFRDIWVKGDVEIKANNKDWAKHLCKKTGQYEGCGGSKEFVYGDALIVLDDFRQLHPQHQLQLDVITLLGLRTKMNIDIFYCVWNPSLLLDQLAGFTNRYSIFYTMTQAGGFSNKIPNYVPCEQAAKLINNYVTHYNVLDEGQKYYPNFPHIIVRDDYESKMWPVNIDEKKFWAINKKAS